MTVRSDSIFYYGKVEKIGADGSSLHRGLLVTQSSLLVCFPSGGVTRTISLPAVREATFAKDNNRHCCSMRVQGEPPLVVEFAKQEETDAFVDALTRVAGHVRILRGSASPAQGRENGLIPSPQYAQVELPRRGVHFADPPAAASSEETTIGVRQRFSSPPPRFARSVPVHSLENIPRAPNLLDPPQQSHTLLAQREQEENQQPRQHPSPFRRETSPHVFGSPEKSSSLYERDPTRALTAKKPKNGSSRSSPKRDEMGELHDAYSTAVTSTQDRLSTEVEMKGKAIARLRSELQDRNAFIDDLKAALRSQEGAFQEMLKATEELRHAEAGRAEVEKQAQLLRAEVRRLESTLQERDESHRRELAAKITELQEAHTTEVAAVREAFAHYDQQMSDYVEKIASDHEREGQKWQNDQRLVQKLVAQQRNEIAELTDALAGTRHMSSERRPSRHSPPLEEWVREARTQGTPRGGDSESRRRAATPNATLSTPALQDRLASLEESHARDRLREKLSRYARGRARRHSSLSRSEHEDGFVEANVRDCGRVRGYSDEAVEEEGRNGFTESGRLMTPGVCRDAKTISLNSTPVRASRAIRNRGIL